MEQRPDDDIRNSLKSRVYKIRIIIIITEIIIILSFIIGITTDLWNPSIGTLLYLLMFMMIPLVFLINPENPHEE